MMSLRKDVPYSQPEKDAFIQKRIEKRKEKERRDDP